MVAAGLRNPDRSPELAQLAARENLNVTILAMDVDDDLSVAHTVDRVTLMNPTPPSLVAAKVLEIAVDGTWQLRHPVGPDAAPFMAWRQSMSDEGWVGWGALDDDAWYARVKADSGIDARPEVDAS